jgi:hypothetical protein
MRDLPHIEGAICQRTLGLLTDSSDTKVKVGYP